ncbi:MAG: 3-methyl-2-oxobutanoate hydroxymethyltransferase, partial [Chitinophagales bacterium]|nr:3-methyl-2-oxobutanoate hydroxymethyltransferase [Hyphomicrobiales bacterium]
AVKSYAQAVKFREFPGPEHVYGMRREQSVEAAPDAPVTKKTKITGT